MADKKQDTIRKKIPLPHISPINLESAVRIGALFLGALCILFLGYYLSKNLFFNQDQINNVYRTQNNTEQKTRNEMRAYLETFDANSGLQKLDQMNVKNPF